MNYDFSKITALIDQSETIFISGHISPDCDAVGSSLALYQLISARGKKAVVIYSDVIPENLHFLPYFERIITPEQIDCKPDLILLNDCSTPKRAGELWLAPYLPQTPVAVIDHHASAEEYPAVKVIDPEAAACGQLIYALAQDWQMEITCDLATCLFAAISADTGGFRFANTTQAAFQVGADLMAYGIDTETIRINLFESRTKAAIKIIGTVFSNMQQSEDLKLVWTTISLEDKARCQAQSKDCSFMSGYTLFPLGVKVGILFEELSDGIVKLSMRSRPGYSVADLATSFGGGGHVLAAGCRIKGDLNTVVDKVLNRAQTMFDVVGVVK